MSDRASKANSELDELDRRLVALLRTDGRASNRELARALGITERTVRTRLRQLLEADLLRVVAITDAFAEGDRLMITLGIQVADRSPAEVAAELEKLPAVNTVHVMSGEHDVEALVLTDSLNFARDILDIPGIRHVSPGLILEVYKHETDWVPFT